MYCPSTSASDSDVGLRAESPFFDSIYLQATCLAEGSFAWVAHGAQTHGALPPLRSDAHQQFQTRAEGRPWTAARFTRGRRDRKRLRKSSDIDAPGVQFVRAGRPTGWRALWKWAWDNAVQPCDLFGVTCGAWGGSTKLTCPHHVCITNDLCLCGSGCCCLRFLQTRHRSSLLHVRHVQAAVQRGLAQTLRVLWGRDLQVSQLHKCSRTDLEGGRVQSFWRQESGNRSHLPSVTRERSPSKHWRADGR